MVKKHKGKIPSLVILGFIIILLLIPNSFENPNYERFQQVKAEVLSVDNHQVQDMGILSSGLQSCEIKILQGPNKGEIVSADNLLSGSLETDKLYEAGDKALVLADFRDSNSVKATLVDLYRLPYELILVAIFVLLLVCFAGWVGVRAILSFIFTMLSIFKILIPLFLKGIHPILLGAGVTILTSTVIILLVYGWNRQFAAATISAVTGTLFTAVLAYIFVELFQIHGAVMEYSESLLYAGYSGLNLTSIFIASIFITSSGAVTDIAVDITSALQELVEKKPELSVKELIASGMVIGKNNIATMTTTLLLAYSGGYIGLLMVFVAQGTPLISILNLNYVSAEILNTMVGSIGLVLVAPISAVITGKLLARKQVSVSAVENKESYESVS